MTKFLNDVNLLVWGAPTLVLILGVGLFLSLRTGFVQIRLFPRAVRSFLRKLTGRDRSGEGSPFQALCTALAATVGTGNIAGVAGAICLGGPGAVFWMWISAGLGMATKYAEATLAVRYRQKDGSGGPMYIITRGMGKKWRWMGTLYSLFGLIASFGVGNATQINAVITGMNGVLRSFGAAVPQNWNAVIGLIMAALVGRMLFGGAKRIGAAAERLVPFASAVYILLCAGVLCIRAGEIPGAVAAIFQGALDPKAVTGGMLGSCFQALRVGCSRGVFTNEAGMGTAAIAHASAQTPHPSEQGLMGIMEVFLDTILICTLTALVILCSGVTVPYGADAGAELTGLAFACVYGDWAAVLIALALCCFAFATVLGWGLYGARCAEFLFGKGSWKWFALAQTLAVIPGAVLDTGAVWSFSEIFNGLMAVPNLIMLAALTPELARLTKEYIKKSDAKAVSGGNYADFHQRKPLRALSYAEIPPLCGGSQKAGQKHLSSEHRPA